MPELESLDDVFSCHLKSCALQRTVFMSKVVTVVGVIRMFLELTINYNKSTIQYKLIVLSIYSLPVLHLLFLKRFSSWIKFTSFLVGEFFNIGLLFLGYVANPDVGLIYCQIAPYSILFYQSSMVIGLKSSLLWALKQTLVWILPGVYLAKFGQSFGMMIGATSSLFIMQTIFCYFDYLKAMEICRAKHEIKILSNQLVLILESIPDCVMVISEDHQILFSNSAIRNIARDRPLIDFLHDTEYSQKYVRQNSRLLIEDILRGLTEEVGKEIAFGVTEIGSMLFEWNGKLVQWDERVAIIISGRNITNIAQMEKAKAESEDK
jgi:PAS domain-containing protein